MAYVLEIENPFEPFNHVKSETDCATVLAWIKEKHGEDWEQFERPTLVIVNGEPIMQKDYSMAILCKEDVMSVVVLSGDIFTIIVVAIISVVAVAAAVVFAPQAPSITETEQINADTVYSIKGQGNAIKLGQSVPCGYGIVRNWPDYGAIPYNKYIDNRQYQYSLYCLGQGKYSTSDWKIGETPITSFEGFSMQIVNPYYAITLFRDNVVTSDEASILEVFAPNDPDYTGELGPFIINEWDNPIDNIEVDISFPKGLYEQASNGNLKNHNISGYWSYEEIDENGDPVYNEPGSVNVQYYKTVTEKINFVLSAWQIESEVTTVVDHGKADGTIERSVQTNPYRRITVYYTNKDQSTELVPFNYNLATATPQRFTMAKDVSLGRYQIYIHRDTDTPDDPAYGDLLQLDTVRGYGINTGYYGNKTMIAVKILATANLNDRSTNKFNVVQQRYLEYWNVDTQSWQTAQGSRSPVWAALDVLRAEYGAKLDDSFIDLDGFAALHAQLSADGINFDYMFSNPSNVWDTLKTILAVGKCIPMLNGSQITYIKDQLVTYPEVMFTPDNMIAKSFKWSLALTKLNDYDSVEVEYIDSLTYKQSTMLCLVDDDIGDNPERIKAVGITTRDKAYQYGMYRRALKKYRKEVVSFETDLQGHIPSINSMVSVSHDVPRWGESGLVTYWAGEVVHLDKEHYFDPAETYVIAFKQRTGYVSREFFVTPSAETTDEIIVSGLDISLDRNPGEEPVIYTLGIENQVTKILRVKRIVPSDGNTIAIDCVNNDNRVYDFDEVEAPPPSDSSYIGTEDLPEIKGLTVSAVPGDLRVVDVTWEPAAGAVSYLLEYSYDDVVYSFVDTMLTPNYRLVVTPGTVYIRVAAINISQGPWATWTGQVGENTELPGIVENLVLQSEFVGLTCKVQWDAVANAEQYVVNVHRFSDNELLRSTSLNTLTYSYSTDQSIEDFAGNPERKLRIQVYGTNIVGISPEDTNLTPENPLPPMVTGLTSQVTSVSGNIYNIRLVWNNIDVPDLKEYVVFGSFTEGFTPDASNAIYKGSSNNALFTITKANTHYYVRIVALDYWGNEWDNITAELPVELP